MSRRLELVITLELAGVKVDTLLKRHLHLSGTVVRRVKWLEDGILVDGRRVNTRFCPAAGQVLSVRLSDPVRNSGIVPAPGPLDIVYEDEDLIVLNKAAGLPVHPGPGHFSDTLGNFLVDYYEKTGQEADFHPVHRLDRLRQCSGGQFLAVQLSAVAFILVQFRADQFLKSEAFSSNRAIQ